ncbi:MAG TPA: hypothetical protein PLE32_21990, partial [Haliscomenobacter sp.]|nr:hypothetical protein [Haliscomenobacter sp.]
TGRKKYSKTAPMQFEEFDEIKAWWNARTESDQAWQVPIADVLQYDTNGKLLSANLDRKNPNRKTENVYIEPALAIAQILENEQQIVALMEEIKILL